MASSLLEKDPVCGMEVEVKESTPKTTYNEKEYYFCSPACLKSFEKGPEKYMNASHGGYEHQHEHHHCEHHNRAHWQHHH